MILKIQILNTNRNVVKEEKKSFINERRRIRNKYKKKNIEKIKAYYILIKHSISVQTLMKLDSYLTR